MATRVEKRRTLQLVLVLSFISIIAVTPYWTAEPINIPKQIGTLFTATACMVLFSAHKQELSNRKFLFFVLGAALFVLTQITSSIFNDSFSTSLYGTFGRNTGILTFAGYAIIFIAVVVTISLEGLNFAYKWIYTLGLLNSIYALVQWLGIDPAPWDIPYPTKIIGFVGNPNFESSLLAMLSAVFVHEILNKAARVWSRIVNSVLLVLNVFLINQTYSVQGVLVLSAVVFVILALKASQISNKKILLSLLTSGTFALLVLMLGLLGRGPLTDFLASASLDARRIYWKAAVEMMRGNPIFGLGPDTYGDWFRRYKPVGWQGDLETFSNSSHNIFLDIGAGSGVLALLLVILFTIATIFYGIKATKLEVDPTNKASVFLAVFVGFLAQSVVSINQIGVTLVAVVTSGILIGLGLTENQEDPRQKNFNSKSFNRNGKFTQITSTQYLIKLYSGLLVGVLVCLPQITSGLTYRGALLSGDEFRILKAGMSWPRDPMIMNQLGELFLENERKNSACTILVAATREFPNSSPALITYLKADCGNKEYEAKVKENLRYLSTSAFGGK